MKDDNKTNKQLVDELTELRLQNAALKESESTEKYRSLVENLRDVIYELDSQGVVLYISPAVRDMLGFGPDEIVGKSFIDLAYKDDLSLMTEWFSELSKGTEKPSDYRVLNKSGELRWAQTKTRPVIEDGVFKGAHGILIDVTAQRRAEEALRKSEEKYRWVLDNMADVITVMDMNLRFTYVSPSIMRMRGYTPEEAVVQTFEQVMTPESLQISARVFEEEMKLEAGGTADPERIRIVEVEQYRKDGSIVMMENHLSFMRDEAKKPVGIISVSHDITDRRMAEKKLKQTNIFLDSIIENIPNMIFLKDARDLRFVRFNRAGEDLLGYSRDDLLGKSDYDFFPKEQADHFTKKDRDVLNGKEVLDIPEETLQTRSKGERTVHTKKVPLRDEKGEPEFLLGISEDITERKEAEDKIKKQTDAMESAIDGIAILNKDEEYIYLNQAHARIYGYEDAGELIAKSWRTIYDSDQLQRFDAEIMPKFSKEGFWQGETLGIKKDGSKFPQGISLTALGGGGLICVVRDITERKEAEEKLQQTLESLRKAFGAIIQVMVSAIEARDPYTAGHQSRVADLARAIATEMGLPKEKIDGIRMAGSIHDIGKLSIPSEILTKPTKLTNLEYSLIKEHSQKGFEILEDVESPWPLAQIVYQHHERMDGSGYPRKLKGEEILIEARILGVADVVEAMASHRPYRAGLGIDIALEEISKNRGILYDTGAVNACLRLFHEKGYKFD